MGTELTDHNRLQWMRKPALRAIYQDLYRRMVTQCVPGTTLEVGGGSGNLKEYLPDVISSDIGASPWLDLVADAQRLPLAADSLANIVLFDVLHHLEFPLLFLREAERTLMPGGRVLMVEPAITPASWPVYNFLHREPVVLRCEPLAEGRPDRSRDPYDSNQALPTLLFGRFLAAVRERVPALRVRTLDWLSLLAYPLSGGFNAWCLIPHALVRPVLAVEDALPRAVRRRLAFRMLVVLEKEGAHDAGHERRGSGPAPSQRR